MWNIEHTEEEPSTPLSDGSNFDAIMFPLSHTMDEWELLSQMRPGNNIKLMTLKCLAIVNLTKITIGHITIYAPNCMRQQHHSLR